MEDIKFIYWFAFYNEDSPSVRYRAKYPLAFFKDKFGIRSTLVVPSYKPKKILHFLSAYFSALLFRKEGSLIVIQRVHSNFIYSTLLKVLVKVRNKNSIYDLDDADYLYMPSKNIYWFVKNCHGITAGSREIKRHLLPYNENIVITTSPTQDLGLVKRGKSKLFNIGWIGGFGGDHKKSLISIVFPAIKSLNFNCVVTILGVKTIPDLEFIKNYFSDNELIETVVPLDIDWKNETDIQNRILDFDIGIATLLDNEIQLSKSGIKAKQYLNNGIPTLATNLPENDWVVKDGINGYFCNSENDFKKRIIEFYEMNSDLYHRFSIAARESICEFDHNKYFSDLMTLKNTTHNKT